MSGGGGASAILSPQMSPGQCRADEYRPMVNPHADIVRVTGFYRLTLSWHGGIGACQLAGH
jgi:hypothetical protein